MDVERVQKINALALDLLKQGLAADREEAVSQAEKMLSKGDYSSLMETYDKVEDLKKEERGEKVKMLGQEEIKELLEKNASFVVKKIKEYQEQIEKLKKEMEELKNELGGMKGRIDNLKVSGAAGKEPQRRLENKGKEEAMHPRSGNYKDSDVSIEKFFYAGSK